VYDEQTCARCDDETLTRNARTIDTSSFFAWSQALFRNPLSVFPRLWSRESQLSEWTKSSVTSLLRFTSSLNAGEPMRIVFRPEDGPRAAEAYQRRFGYRGERLIEQLGNGLGPDVRLRKPVPSVFLTPPSFPFRGW